MATHVSDARGPGYPTEMQEMDWSYPPQDSRQHYTTSLNLEFRMKNEKWTTEKHVDGVAAIWKQM